MIKAGDKVRYSNEYIAKHQLIAPGQKRGKRRSKWFNRRRGDQRVMTVVRVIPGRYDWKIKKYTGDIVVLDIENTVHNIINTHWLRFVRRDT